MEKLKKSIWYKHKEFLSLPFAWVLWYLINGWSVKHYPGLALHDGGIFEAVFLATVCLFTGSAIVWFMLKVFFPEMYYVLDEFITKFKNELTIWQKGLFSLVVFSVYLIAWAILIKAFV